MKDAVSPLKNTDCEMLKIVSSRFVGQLAMWTVVVLQGWMRSSGSYVLEVFAQKVSTTTSGLLRAPEVLCVGRKISLRL